MELRLMTEKVSAFVKKYRYVVIILIAGMILMLIPDFRNVGDKEVLPAETEEMPDISTQLQNILERIDGAGKVRVMVTCSSGEKILYQTDESDSKSENSGSSNKQTVIVSGADREEQGLVSQVLAPEYLGAVVVCQGADKTNVRLAITEAVSAATGLGADRIVVLRMK